MRDETDQDHARLSPIQARILRAIDSHIRQEEQSPTLRELAVSAQIKTLSHLAYQLERLQSKGYITRDPHRSRSIRLTCAPGVPVLGSIAAGEPLHLFDLAEDEGPLDLGAHLRGMEDAQQYALRVRGNSMIDERIFDGDYILVRPAKQARDREIVVALHRIANGDGGAATVKRFFFEHAARRVLLQPANPAIRPIYVDAQEWDDEWEIQGIVTAVYRPMDRV
jgi:repressor LexA